MKKYIITWALLIVCINCHKNKKTNLKQKAKLIYNIDTLKSIQSNSVIYGKALYFEGNKYSIWKVKVLKVLKKNNNINVNDTISVAHHSWKNKGLTREKECTFYLTPWNIQKKMWFLLKKDSSYGCECK